jgi:plastocyanin
VPPTATPPPPTPTATTPALPTQATINLAAQTFSPANATIAAGGTVTWSWAGDMVHNIVSDGPQSFPGHPEFQTEGTYAFTFTQPGTYNFHCEVHPNTMRGTITVQ